MSMKEAGKHNIIVAGLSYGQGSSREHAAICPMFLGVRAVLAKSLERIHAANLINFGILPLTFTDAADYDTIDQGDELEIPDAAKSVREGLSFVVCSKTRGNSFSAVCVLSERQKKMLLAGGALNVRANR